MKLKVDKQTRTMALFFQKKKKELGCIIMKIMVDNQQGNEMIY